MYITIYIQLFLFKKTCIEHLLKIKPGGKNSNVMISCLGWILYCIEDIILHGRPCNVRRRPLFIIEPEVIICESSTNVKSMTTSQGIFCEGPESPSAQDRQEKAGPHWASSTSEESHMVPSALNSGWVERDNDASEALWNPFWEDQIYLNLFSCGCVGAKPMGAHGELSRFRAWQYSELI